MSTETAQTTEKVAKPKMTPQESAQAKAIQILNAGIAIGKSQGRKEATDSRRRGLAVIANTVAGRREKGKEVSYKSIKASINSLDDDRENADKVKTLAIKLLTYRDQLPEPKPTQPKPTAD